MISSFRKAWVPQGLALCTFLLGMPLGTPARRAPELPNAPCAPAADTSLPAPGAQLPESQPAEETALPPALTRKQKKELLKQNFEKMKRDADELATLAKALQEELAKSGHPAEANAVGAIRVQRNWSAYVVRLIANLQQSVRQHSEISRLRVLLYPSKLLPEDIDQIRRDDAGVVWLGKAG